MLRKSAVTMAAIGALTTAQVQALGLGEVTVHSALNQPLNAEIDLLQVRDLIQSQIIAGLADADDFYLAGVKPTTILSDINFQLDVKNGKGIIRLTTRDPIKEPFLNFLVEVNWPSGRLVREYTVLLDPPVFTAKDLAPRATPSAPVGTSVSSQTAAPAVRPSGAVSQSSTPSGSSQGAAYGGTSYKVGKRDNLWNIALKTRPDRSVSPQQMMLAIQKMNPDAFINNNINRLRSGVVLEIPNKQQIASLDFSTSVKEVKRQNSAWKEKTPKDKSGTKKKAEQLDASKSDSPQQASAGSDEQSQLRIVSKTPEGSTEKSDAENVSVDSDSEGDATGSGVAEELRAKNQELEEQLVVTLEGLDKVERDNTELFQRMERLAEQLESVQRLLLLKDQEMADLQNKLTQAQASPAQAAPSSSQPPTEGFLDKLLQSPAMLGGGAAGLLALLGGILFFTRKRKSDEQGDEKAVEEAMAVLEEREKAAETVDEPVVPEESVDEPPVEEPAKENLAEVDVVDDLDDPFNLATDDDMSDEFEALISDDLDQELGDDLDMDLKIDEPIEEDSEMAEFTASLLNDEEYDLAGEDEENLASDDELQEAFDEIDAADETVLEKAVEEPSEDEAAVDSVDNELDFILAEETSDIEIEEDTAAIELDSEDELSELDMILEESEAESSSETESANELSIDDIVEENIDDVVEDNILEESVADDEVTAEALSLDDVDDLEIDGLDAILGEDSEDTLAEDSGLEELMEDADLAEVSGLDTVEAVEDEEEDLLGDDALDDLLNQAETHGGNEPDSVNESVAEMPEDAELNLEDFDLDGEESNLDDEDKSASEVSELDLGEIDALDDELDDLELEMPGLSLDEPVDSEQEETENGSAEESTESGSLDEIDLDDLISEVEEDTQLAEAASDEGVELSLESPDDITEDLDELPDSSPDESPLMSLEAEEDLDEVNDDELEAELNLMLEGDDNELDLEETDVSDSSEELNYLDASDELGTKLDLARAYIDMDDPDGARDILQEVIKDGDGPQKAEATKLLDELGS